MQNLVIKSVSQADGWFRVVGLKNSHKIEKIALWAVIASENSVTKNVSDYIPVGIIADDIGCSGIEFEHLMKDVAGYVHETDFSDGDINDDAFKRLVWD